MGQTVGVHNRLDGQNDTFHFYSIGCGRCVQSALQSCCHMALGTAVADALNAADGTVFLTVIRPFRAAASTELADLSIV